MLTVPKDFTKIAINFLFFCIKFCFFGAANRYFITYFAADCPDEMDYLRGNPPEAGSKAKNQAVQPPVHFGISANSSLFL